MGSRTGVNDRLPVAACSSLNDCDCIARISYHHYECMLMSLYYISPNVFSNLYQDRRCKQCKYATLNSYHYISSTNDHNLSVTWHPTWTNSFICFGSRTPFVCPQMSTRQMCSRGASSVTPQGKSHLKSNPADLATPHARTRGEHDIFVNLRH